MNLQEIVWPVFLLRKQQPTTEDGVTFYRSEYTSATSEEVDVSLRIVDDKRIAKPTLGKRRLALLASGVRLYPIGRAVYFLADLLKLAGSTAWFIDTAGVVFQHKKAKRVKLLCKKITRVVSGDTTGAVVELQGIPTRFKTMFKPSSEELYAGVLQLGVGYIFYGFYKDPFKDSWRLI